MKDIQLQENTVNFSLANKDFYFTDTPGKRVQQILRAKLRKFKGTDYLDVDAGIDYIGELQTKSINYDKLADLMKVQILETEGVQEILEFDLTQIKETRQLNVSFTITVNEETITVDEVI